MSEMIERVARGMCRAAITKPAAVMYSPEGVEYHVNKRWPEYVDHARSALEEIRQIADERGINNTYVLIDEALK